MTSEIKKFFNKITTYLEAFDTPIIASMCLAALNDFKGGYGFKNMEVNVQKRHFLHFLLHIFETIPPLEIPSFIQSS